MDPGTFLSDTLEALRRWARGHQRTLVAGGCWALAALFIAFSIWKLLQSLSLV